MPLPNLPQSLNPNVSVDCVIFGFEAHRLKVLLIERLIPVSDGEPTSSILTLPGDLIRDDEDLDFAAQRILLDLTSLHDLYLEQFHAFGALNRFKTPADRAWLRATRAQPEARVITVAYYSLVNINDYQPHPSSFATKTEWYDVDGLPALAFDHGDIFQRGLQSLRNRILKEPVGFELLPDQFTLTELQTLHETILGTSLDKRNFRKKILRNGFVVPLMQKQKGVTHKPARYYKFDKEAYTQMSEQGQDPMSTTWL